MNIYFSIINLFFVYHIIIVREHKTRSVVAIRIAIGTIETKHACKRAITKVTTTAEPRVSSRRKSSVL